MRTLPAPKLVALVAAIMEGGGSGEAEARTIAERLVDSNLVGHDSHGVLRVGQVPRMGARRLGSSRTRRRRSCSTATRSRSSTAIADSGRSSGEFATRLGIAKAAKTGIAMIGLRNCGHLGRLGDWAEMAAEAGQVSLHFLNTSGAQRVAPFGGSDRRLSTNPMAIGVPARGRDAGDPRHHDVDGRRRQADGRAEQGRARARRLDRRQGRAPDDVEPKDFYDGGALLTIGAHKGSGLSIITDLLAGAVTTGRSSDPADDDPAQQHAVDLSSRPRCTTIRAACWPKRGASSIS